MGKEGGGRLGMSGANMEGVGRLKGLRMLGTDVVVGEDDANGETEGFVEVVVGGERTTKFFPNLDVSICGEPKLVKFLLIVTS